MMKNRSKVVSIFWVLLLSLQFLLLPSICSAEQVYLITETELTTLENNFSSLEQINKSSLEKSERQEKSLKKAEKSLPPSAPGVLREIGAKIDIDHYVTGISYGVSRRIGGKYIGFRGEYDWQDKKTGVWVTYAY